MCVPVDSDTTLVLPKPAYKVLRRLTGESRPDVALSLGLKNLVSLKMEAARASIHGFEEKYRMDFAVFQEKWQAGEIAEAHSYAVEQDYWAWEAAITDLNVLEELADWMV
jgi:hypothetical protein